jgi:hypothetical protein
MKSLRNKNGDCVLCTKIFAATYYKKHKKKVKKKASIYRLNNKLAIKKCQQRWYQKNKKKRQKIDRAYYEENKVAILKRKKKPKKGKAK